MTIAFIDALHDVRFTRNGSRKHETVRVSAPVPVEIRSLTRDEVRTVAVMAQEDGSRRDVLSWEGDILAPVLSASGIPFETASLTGHREKLGLALGRAFDRKAWTLHGASGVPKRSELPIGRLLADGLDESRAQVEAIGRGLADIDGRLYERAWPPAWIVYQVFGKNEVLAHRVESADPREMPREGGARASQLFCAHDKADAEAYAAALAARTGSRLRWLPGGIEVLDPGALAFDAAKTSALAALQGTLASITRKNSVSLQQFDDRTLLAFMALRRAVESPPERGITAPEARDILAEYATALHRLPMDVRGMEEGIPEAIASMVYSARGYVLRHDTVAKLHAPEPDEDARFLAGL